jgi:GntR family transcriptional regulator
VYIQLAGILRAQIRSGELAPRRPVPSIRTLMQTYEVSDGTVKKAVQVLRDEGLVRTVPGRGVYVVELRSPGEPKSLAESHFS